MGLLYSKRPARPHGFNEANDKIIRVHGAEISPIFEDNFFCPKGPPRFVGGPVGRQRSRTSLWSRKRKVLRIGFYLNEGRYLYQKW